MNEQSSDTQSILDSIKAGMEAYEQEFKKIESNIISLSERLELLKNNREQIRGAYTGLYNQYIKFAKESDIQNLSPKAQEVKDEEIKEEVKSEEVKEENKEENKLTPDQLNRLKEQLNKQSDNTPESNSSAEVPDYLVDEYRKLNK